MAETKNPLLGASLDDINDQPNLEEKAGRAEERPMTPNDDFPFDGQKGIDEHKRLPTAMTLDKSENKGVLKDGSGINVDLGDSYVNSADKNFDFENGLGSVDKGQFGTISSPGPKAEAKSGKQTPEGKKEDVNNKKPSNDDEALTQVQEAKIEETQGNDPPDVKDNYDDEGFEAESPKKD